MSNIDPRGATIPVDGSPDTFSLEHPAETYQKLRRPVYAHEVIAVSINAIYRLSSLSVASVR
ncbi:MAG: hypothetical protein V5A54_09780, partial [Haloarculaceae archaeon]